MSNHTAKQSSHQKFAVLLLTIFLCNFYWSHSYHAISGQFPEIGRIGKSSRRSFYYREPEEQKLERTTAYAT